MRSNVEALLNLLHTADWAEFLHWGRQMIHLTLIYFVLSKFLPPVSFVTFIEKLLYTIFLFGFVFMLKLSANFQTITVNMLQINMSIPCISSGSIPLNPLGVECLGIEEHLKGEEGKEGQKRKELNGM